MNQQVETRQEPQRFHSARKSRWLYSAIITLTVVGLVSLAAPSAKADSWNFTLTNPGNTTTITFSFPVGSSVVNLGGYFQISSPVNWSLNGVSQGTVLVDFFNTPWGGGLSLGNLGEILNLLGAQLYTGSESSPTFIEGIYHLTSSGTEQFNSDFTLVLTDPPGDDTSATPEPGTLGLLGLGLSGMAGVVRKRLRMLLG